MASHPPLPVRIPTAIPNLYLRTPQPTQHEAEGLSKIFSHKFNDRFEPDRPGRKEPTAAFYAERIPSWLEMAEKGQNCFCLLALGTDGESEDDIIGFGGFNDLSSSSNGKDTKRIANIGVMIHEPYTGKGYGIAAMRATIDAAFEMFAVDLVEAETFAINEPFRGLMKKLKLDQFSIIKSEEGPGEVDYSFSKVQWESVK